MCRGIKRSSQGVLERGEQTEHPETEEHTRDDDHQGPDRSVPPEDLGTVEDPEGKEIEQCQRCVQDEQKIERDHEGLTVEGHGKGESDYRKDYAQYFVKFIAAMKQQGIDIYAVCPQNEPLNPGNCASLYMPWQEEAPFVAELAAAFKQNGLKTSMDKRKNHA